MSKFKINDEVNSEKYGNGIVRAREVKTLNGKTDVKYLVDFGDDIENWKILKKNDLEKVKRETEKNPYKIKTYGIDGGKILTIASNVSVCKDYVLGIDGPYVTKIKTLRIGFSLYNGVDDYDENIGRKYAIHRCKKNPFTTMISEFSGEFNDSTIDAIMDVKADYIISNIDKFYRPQ